VAKDLDLTESALRLWVQRADGTEGKGAPGALSQAEREELVQLRRENRQLQMERELLKKWAAFFAKESSK
jgi:transposase